MLTDDGTAFRVWAPNAKQVHVVGDFNDWSNDQHAMESEDNGYWYAFVEKAKAGDEYKLSITPQEGDAMLKKRSLRPDAHQLGG